MIVRRAVKTDQTSPRQRVKLSTTRKHLPQPRVACGGMRKMSPLEPRPDVPPTGAPIELFAPESSMVHQIRMMQNGAGWYWEVLDREGGVIERGIADTHAQARADAERASRALITQCWAHRSPRLQQGGTCIVRGR